jgi:hypothetical protein
MHLFCPLLAILLPGPFKLAKMMCVAQWVIAILLKVWFPMSMDERAVKILQDPNGIHGFTTSFCVREKQGPYVIAGRMQPMEFAVYVNACFVDV